MKKQLKTLVITGIAAVVLLGAWLIISALMPKEENPDQEKTYLVKENYQNYATLSVEYPEGRLDDHTEGYKYLIGQLPLEDGSGLTYQFFDNGVDDHYAYSQSLMNSTFTKLAQLEYVEVVEENVTNLAKYGLNPERVVRITLRPYDEQNTPQKVLLVGNKYELGDYYYVMLEGEDTVYTCKGTALDVFLRGSKGLRDLAIVPSFGDNFANVKKVEIEKPDGQRIAFERIPSEELEGASNVFSTFRLLEPYGAYGNDAHITDDVLNPLSQVLAMDVVEDRVKDLAQYGLDKPFRVTITLEGRKEPLTLLFGSQQAGTGLYYVMVEGVDSVYLAMSLMSDFKFLTVDPLVLRSGLVWLHAIKDVTEVTLNLPSGKFVLWVDDQKDLDTHTGTFLATLNGTPISEDNARKLYQSVISIAYDSELATELQETEPSYSFTIKYRNSKRHYLSLYKVNSRQFAVRLDYIPLDEVGFTVNISSLRKIEENVQTILSGGTIKD